MAKGEFYNSVIGKCEKIFFCVSNIFLYLFRSGLKVHFFKEGVFRETVFQREHFSSCSDEQSFHRHFDIDTFTTERLLGVEIQIA